MKATAQTILEALGGQRRIHYQLDNIRKALHSLGNPQNAIPCFTFAGTNGKGSTALFVSSVLKEQGYTVLTYLSPHLESPCERFLRNLVPISTEELDALACRLVSVAEKFELTYFEFLTLLFFVWAKEQDVDFLLLEVGLGGRLDATAVAPNIASVITNIGLDHQEFLGNTRAEILKEKMGILRPETLLFSGIAEADLRKQLEDHCNELDTIYYYSNEIRIEQSELNWSRQEFTLNGTPFRLHNTGLAMQKNAALAFLFLRIVFPKVSLSTIQAGFERVQIPGRMEVLQNSPRVVLSASHNTEGIELLLDTLARLPQSHLHFLCGFLPNKPYQPMYSLLKNSADSITLTTADPSIELPPEYLKMDQFLPDPTQALRQKLSEMTAQDTLVITGSIYLIGEMRKQWNKPVCFLSNLPKDLPPFAGLEGDASQAKHH